MLGKVSFIAGQQCPDVVGHEIDLAAQLFFFAGLESADAKVGVETDNDALEKFLVRFPSRRQDHFFVGGKTTNQAVVRGQWIERSRIHVRAIDVPGRPDLARRVAGARCPRFRGHPLQASAKKNERFCQVALLIAAGEFVNADAGLRPMCLRRCSGWVFGNRAKIDFVVAGRNRVTHNNAIVESAFQLQFALAIVTGDEFCRMADCGLPPVAVRRAGATVGFDVPNLDPFAREMLTRNREHVVGPRNRQVRCRVLCGDKRTRHKQQKQRDIAAVVGHG